MVVGNHRCLINTNELCSMQRSATGSRWIRLGLIFHNVLQMSMRILKGMQTTTAKNAIVSPYFKASDFVPAFA